MSDFSGADFSAAVSATDSPASPTPDVSPAAPEPTTATVTTEPPAPAATVQADATASPVPEKPKGPIPFDVHHTALENARIKAREEIQKEWEPHAWVKDAKLTRDDITSWSRIANRMSTDKIGFIRDYIAEVQQQDPQAAAQLRSEAARILSAGRRPAVDLSPDVDVYGENNQVVARTFSADRVKAIVDHAVNEAIGREVGPLKQDHQRRVSAEREAAQTQRITAAADAVMQDVKDILGDDKAAYTEVDKLMAQHPDWTATKAAWHYHKTVVLPGLSKTERTKVLADLSQKPAATTVSPSSSTISAPKPDSEKSWEELFREKAAAAAR